MAYGAALPNCLLITLRWDALRRQCTAWRPKRKASRWQSRRLFRCCCVANGVCSDNWLNSGRRWGLRAYMQTPSWLRHVTCTPFCSWCHQARHRPAILNIIKQTWSPDNITRKPTNRIELNLFPNERQKKYIKQRRNNSMSSSGWLAGQCETRRHSSHSYYRL